MDVTHLGEVYRLRIVYVGVMARPVKLALSMVGIEGEQALEIAGGSRGGLAAKVSGAPAIISRRQVNPLGEILNLGFAKTEFRNLKYQTGF